MLYAIIAIHFIVVPFVIFEVRFQNFPVWLSSIYFYLLGIDMSFIAFSLANAVLSYFASDMESHRWFRVFAMLGAMAAVVLTIAAAILTACLWKKLSLRWTAGASFAVLIGEFALLLCLSRVPQLNWW